MTNPTITEAWTDVETAARAPFLWNNVQKKWLERDRSNAARSLEWLRTNGATALQANNGIWIPNTAIRGFDGATLLTKDFYIPKNADRVRVYVALRGDHADLSSGEVRWEVGAASGNYTDAAGPVVGPVTLSTTCERDISGDAIDGSRQTFTCEFKTTVVDDSPLKILVVFVSSILFFRSVDDLN